jgi:hypothetical protein
MPDGPLTGHRRDSMSEPKYQLSIAVQPRYLPDQSDPAKGTRLPTVRTNAQRTDQRSQR